ncbi:bifunctional folylpolyglutamate synthase/dihydrofolate synthase [bacterium]|nr:bifunctional folylpolyglutamate synthase/dihydrofolate synthase [bacterium]
MSYTYLDAKNLLTSHGKFHINLGLERISAVLSLLDNPQDKLKYFHVAGTNGKGSVCAIISTVLVEAGIKTGLYTSPHLFKYNERIKINGSDISDSDFASLVFEICELADKNDIHLTEFEILTAVMFKYFADNNVEVVVLETGLGGRFDATNVIKENLCAVITHIDLDHTDRLGNTKDKIAEEKAGIIKPNCPVVACEGFEAIRDTADEKNSLLMMIAPFEDTENLSLKGIYQQENLSLALAAIRLVYPRMHPNVIQEALKKVNHPARFQLIEGKNILIDGAHNPNGIISLKESLDFYYPNMRKRYVFGCLRNKDYEKMVSMLFEKNDEIYFYHFNNPNSCTFEELQAVCAYDAKPFESLKKLEYRNDTLTIVCGSFYMINEIVESDCFH